ncbi:MAG: MBL fold metallo-hydrolase [Pseudomonadales bacterium]
MSTSFKILSSVVLITLAVGVLVVTQRHWIANQLLLLDTGGEPPPLVDASEESAATVWFDDYFTIEKLAPGTYAIGEPRYYQENYNYLLVGENRAVLFDAGPGVRDIIPVVKSITNLPVVFLPSHFHYDHVGNGIRFEQRAVVDLPYLRSRAENNVLQFSDMEHLGEAEGFATPSWAIDFWWLPGEAIDLGGRSVEIVHTPGHSTESISLWDQQNDIMLSGDYIYPGPLYAFLPNSSLTQYYATAKKLLSTVPQSTKYFGAHRSGGPGAPQLNSQDLEDLRKALEHIRDGHINGEGIWPIEYPVNERMKLLAERRALQDW